MKGLQITAETREKAEKEALRRLEVPLEALEIEWSEEEEDELLAGARPMVQMTVRVRKGYVIDRIVETLEALLEKIGYEAEIQTVEEPELTFVRIDTEHAEVLIGHRGETLDALQHLVVRMTGIGGREMPLILIDVGDYRQRRLERLRKVSRNLANLALENGQEEFFDPMSATDRKIVHTILKDIEGVTSFSKGEELSRHVVVAPE